MTIHYVSKPGFSAWLSRLEGKEVFAPQATAKGASLRRWSGESPQPPALDKARAAQSAKGFFLPAVETVARYGQEAGRPVAVAEAPMVLVGVRACELRAWTYLDRVMLGGDFIEPSYQARRQRSLVVSCDCVDCAATCFCTFVGGKPYVEAGSDLNATDIGDGYVVEPFSDRGRQLLSSGEGDWQPATPEQLARRGQAREAMVRRLEKQNAEFPDRWTDDGPPKLPEGDDEVWQRHAADCVECGACTNICPTCHCFYLFDHMVKPKSAERVRNWDSCLLATYHRMAGGVNMKLSPRPELRSRLANRILHKYVYSPQQYQMLGCVGCGRCIDACLGAIDIRKAVEDLKR